MIYHFKNKDTIINSENEIRNEFSLQPKIENMILIIKENMYSFSKNI